MSFNYNAKGVKPWSGGSYLIPAGRYRLKIIDTEEGKTKKEDPMVRVDFKVMGGEHDGKTLKFHNVTFFGRDEDGASKPGAGIAIHFLKTIGQPWEGDFQVDHMKWRGKELDANVIEDVYNGKVSNKVKEVFPAGANVDKTDSQKEELEEVPF